MGICEANNKNINRFDNIPSISHKQLKENTPNHSYKYNFDNIKNSFNKTYNLKFTFSNFRIKYCISHKPDRNSFYMTEIKLGEKEFPLVINTGQSPNIPNLKDNESYFIEKEFKFDELEKTFLFINIFEYTEDMPSLNMSMKSVPNELKARAKYNSYFRINLASFLFKSSNCEFPLMGNNQLSFKTRIAFNCSIEQKEKIKIIAQCKNSMNSYIKKLILEHNDNIITCDTKLANGCFVITTPPMTIHDLQNSDLYLETNEDENYSYISLNKLKYQIIVNLGKKVIKYSEMDKIKLHKPLDISTPSLKSSSILDIFTSSFQNTNSNDAYYGNNAYKKNYYTPQDQSQNIFGEYEAGEHDGIVLFFYDIPIFSQINNFYFTEYGVVYNTSILNIINEDPDLHNFRRNKQISSDDFRQKLNIYYQEILKPNYNLNVLNDIQILLKRSIDTDRFMFIYPKIESLTEMVILMIRLGITIIDQILKSKETYITIQLIIIINILMRREELDNSVIYYIFKNISVQNPMPFQYYNELNSSLYNLYVYLLSNQAPQNSEEILIELFSRLYFKNNYFRRIMLSTLSGKNYVYNKNVIDYDYDRFLFDEINNEKLNRYIYDNTINLFEQFSQNENSLSNIKFDKSKLFKRIIASLNDKGIYKYPFEFSLFKNIKDIISILVQEIVSYRDEKINKPPLNTEFYEMLMFFSYSYDSITSINNALINSTNIHNQYAIFTLFIYFKSLLEYNQSLTNSKLIFDYTVFEKASELLVQDEDSVSLPRLFWFYYSYYNLVLRGNLKWFIAQIVNKNFDKFAYHWSFTIRQVYYKFLIFVISDKLKDKEGRLFNQQKLNPFRSRNSINYQQKPYSFESMKDFDTICKEYNLWKSTRRGDNAELPIFSLPPPMLNAVGGLE